MACKLFLSSREADRGLAASSLPRSVLANEINPRTGYEDKLEIDLGGAARRGPGADGDLRLESDLTAELLMSMRLDTGHAEMDAAIGATVRMCLPEIADLMSMRDEVLAPHADPDKLGDPDLELLSELAVDLDAKLRG